MNYNELNKFANLIWSNLNTIENQNKTKQEQIDLIKPIIIEICSDQRKLGRTQILNYMEDEIIKLRD